MADALAEDGGDDAVRRPLHQLPRQSSRRCSSPCRKLVDPEVIHQPELVVGERLQGWSTGTGPVDSPPLALRWSIVMQRKSCVNASIALITAGWPVADAGVRPHRG